MVKLGLYSGGDWICQVLKLDDGTNKSLGVSCRIGAPIECLLYPSGQSLIIHCLHRDLPMGGHGAAERTFILNSPTPRDLSGSPRQVEIFDVTSSQSPFEDGGQPDSQSKEAYLVTSLPSSLGLHFYL